MIHSYNSKLKQLSRNLRKNGTLAEVLLWNQLKGRKIKGIQFTRQKPIGAFIVDFYCATLNLIIEVDGVSHEVKGVDTPRPEGRGFSDYANGIPSR